MSFGDLVREVRAAVDPRVEDPSTPYIGLEHLPEHSLAVDCWGSASEVASSKFRYEVGDILFGKIRPYFRKVAPPPVSGICSTDAIVMRPRYERFQGLALAVSSSEAFVAEAVQTSQGTKMPRANWKVLQRYLVAVPDEAVLAPFDHLVNNVVSLIHDLVMASRSLRAARDLLLPRLVSGEIDVEELDIQVSDAA